MMNIQKMMQQAQQVQFKIAEVQEKFKDIEVEGASGGGLIKVKMNCVGDVLGVDIDPSVIDPSDKEVLEDLIMAAINSAQAVKNKRVQDETGAIMKEMGLPADAKLPF